MDHCAVAVEQNDRLALPDRIDVRADPVDVEQAPDRRMVAFGAAGAVMDDRSRNEPEPGDGEPWPNPASLDCLPAHAGRAVPLSG
jgi:hypothetical protein